MSDTTTEALARSVLTIDGARRVGWAKAYAAEDKLDGALRDLNVMRGDRDAYRKGVSFMFGLVAELSRADTGTTSRQRLIRQTVEQYAGVNFIMDDDAVRSGRERANRTLEADAAYAEEAALDQRIRDEKRAISAKRTKEHQHEWKRQRQRMLRQVAGRYGFATVEAMFDVLAKWQAATGAPERRTAKVTWRDRGDFDKDPEA